MLSERILGSGVLGELPRLCSRFNHGITMIADEITYEAAGKRVEAVLPEYTLTRHVFSKTLKADKAHIFPILEAAKNADLLIAVGSGTINDLTKYTAHQLKIPYLCVATAASMNGYSAANASLLDNGHKHSYLATPPLAVIVDLDVLAASPKRLTRSGLADTLARTTVEADCLLSHYVLGTPYPKEAFDALRAHETTLLNEASKLGSHDPTFLAVLMNALLDAGDWMTRTGSSAVASQGEHMIAHTLELLYEPEVRYLYHGELVGIATLAYNQLQHKLLLGDPLLRNLSIAEETFIRRFGAERGKTLAAEYPKKLLNSEITPDWKTIKSRLSGLMVTPNKLERSFAIAGLPKTSEELKIQREHFNAALTYAHLTRNRFTFLDIAAMMTRRAS